MKKILTILTALSLLAVLPPACACADADCRIADPCGVHRPAGRWPGPRDHHPPRDIYYDNEPYDIGIPDLHGKILQKDQMNLTVFWVQTQMKATGVYYQGEIWDETGNLGDHTMQEIASFMRDRGYRRHDGRIDQNVINELAAYLGRRLVPVYAGGFYNCMDSIMSGGCTGSMQPIVSNLRDMIPHVTTGARWVQCCLKKLGYYTGTIDGKYGENTEKAVMTFQEAAGFQQRDYVSLGVARAMLEQYYRAGGDLNALPGVRPY